MLLEFSEKHLGVIASILTSLGVIWAARKPLGRLSAECMFLIRGPFVIRQMLNEMNVAVNQIRYQVQTNDGGSLKDAVMRTEQSVGQLKSFRKHDFWTAPKPGFELDGDGKVFAATEASCRLFRVADTDELTVHSWLRFLDGSRVNDFMRSFRETSASGSLFQFSIRLRSGPGENRGEWEFRATLIDHSGSKLYSGYFTPVDETAKAIAQRAGWQV